MRLFVAFLILTMGMTACKESSQNVPMQSNHQEKEVSINYNIPNGGFAHTVYFWLHNPGKAEDRAAFEASLKRFILNSPDISTRHIGTPAGTSRDVIDGSYTYSLLLTFPDKEAQDKYQVDPAHLKFIEESSALWSKVVVYDSENILE